MPPRLTPGRNLQIQQNLQNSARPSGSAREEVTQREPVDEQPQPQPDLADSGMAMSTETPDAEATWWTRILTEKSDLQCRPKVPKRMRIWSKHSRPLTPAVVSEQAEKRAKIPTSPSVNNETFAMMLEVRPATWRVPTGKEQEIISSRFVDSGELRRRLVSRGDESNHTDPASLFAATPSVVATRIALVLGLAQDVEMAMAEISGAFLHAVLEKHFFVTPPTEYHKTTCCVEDKEILVR